MKKISPLLLLAIAITCMACNKKNCWKCTTTYTGSAYWWVPKKGNGVIATHCDKTEAEIRKIEKDGTGTETMIQNDKSYTATKETTCK